MDATFIYRTQGIVVVVSSLIPYKTYKDLHLIIYKERKHIKERNVIRGVSLAGFQHTIHEEKKEEEELPIKGLKRKGGKALGCKAKPPIN